VATTLRAEAEALMVGRDAEPLLAVGRHGLGRSAAFTSDLNAWLGELGAWPELPGVLGTVVRWLQARPDATASPPSGAARASRSSSTPFATAPT
jgi:uncharacterized membrane protein